jgi:16S rRNA (guanine1516-N2)-methyltransferase
MQPSFVYRLSRATLKTELIAKAVAVKKYKNILDATAGLGKDAFILASFGCKLRAIEQNKIVANLLADNLTKYRNSTNKHHSEIAHRITLYNCNAIDFLNQLESTNLPDVIYLDPMFPPNNKSALVKKDMQLLAKLLANDVNDDATLLELSLTKAKHRVVVKRHKLSPTLSTHIPQYKIFGTTNRFDIYLCPCQTPNIY